MSGSERPDILPKCQMGMAGMMPAKAGKLEVSYRFRVSQRFASSAKKAMQKKKNWVHNHNECRGQNQRDLGLMNPTLNMWMPRMIDRLLYDSVYLLTPRWHSSLSTAFPCVTSLVILSKK